MLRGVIRFNLPSYLKNFLYNILYIAGIIDVNGGSKCNICIYKDELLSCQS